MLVPGWPGTASYCVWVDQSGSGIVAGTMIIVYPILLTFRSFSMKKILFSESYDKARMKLRQSEDCSDLQTDQEQEQTRKRR